MDIKLYCGYECNCEIPFTLVAGKDGRPKPYGNVTYADPENGKYPIDTESHVRAAWSYINMPRNAKKYSSSKLAKIKGRIRAAAKKFGIKISDENKSMHLSLFSSSKIHSIIEPPDATDTHFFTSGRILSYFPQINKNGFTFFKEDCDSVVSTLIGSTTDLQHVKLGLNVQDPLNKFKNTTCGAIIEVQNHDNGIDILCKIERSQVAAMGFTSEDFEPDNGIFASYSQECDFNASESKFIVVDKNDNSKLLKTYSFAEGLAKGFPFTPGSNRGPSYEGPDGKWNYTLDDGNPVFMSVKPLSFTGVGHVMKPADDSALTYRLAASFSDPASFPGGDVGGDITPPALMVGDDQPYAKYLGPTGFIDLSDMPAGGTDVNPWFAKDFVKHPDILHADVDKYMDDYDFDGDEPPINDYPNTHYAAVWMDSDYNNQKDGKPSMITKKAFRIRDDKGNLHRGRLIAAYRALMGLRGAHSSYISNIPMECRAFAMALIRKGLENTKPIPMKEKSSHNMDIQALIAGLSEEDAMKAVEAELRKHERVISKAEYEDKVSGFKTEIATLTAQLESAKADNAKLVASFEEASSKLKELTNEKLSAARLAELEAVHAFEETEKKAETFGEYVKGLASMSEESFKIEKLSREIVSRDKAMATLQKSVSSAGIRVPQTQPVPGYSGPDITGGESSKKHSAAELL